MKNDEVRLLDSRGQLSSMYYSPDTDPQVVTVLEDKLHTNTRLRIWIGDTDRPDFKEVQGRDPDAGHTWDDEFEVVGTVGRSMGPKKIPLLIYNSRSYGGGAILTDCIVRIMTTSGYELYRHPNYHNDFDTAEVKTSTLEGYSHAVVPTVGQYAGQEVARFHSEKSAQHYLEFMQGKRFCK